ncbi:MAG: response regulator transcription factor [Syntrophales bacterium]|jgi:DNA-binding NarL/FixJ family response regulator|nr:response regulator transcription factor [Syntrophales bacterium]MCK9528833.1 response regulator transcription factor [Syntrophales bacterium]MDX9921073.1 response regulator transcription factor [Syntrophales bacterium]
MKKIRVLIVDDHPIVRAGFRQILSETDDMEVAGEAANGDDALDCIRENQFDIVLLDISMPGRNGLEILRELKKDAPGLPVLIMSMYPEEYYTARALQAGASGYLTKAGAPNHLVLSIRKILGDRPRPHLSVLAGKPLFHGRSWSFEHSIRSSPRAGEPHGQVRH